MVAVLDCRTSEMHFLKSCLLLESGIDVMRSKGLRFHLCEFNIFADISVSEKINRNYLTFK